MVAGGERMLERGLTAEFQTTKPDPGAHLFLSASIGALFVGEDRSEGCGAHGARPSGVRSVDARCRPSALRSLLFPLQLIM